MATQLGEDTKVTLDLKTIGIVIAGAVSLAAMYFTLQKEIEIAKELPEPAISRTEYDLKDQLVRETIMNTQEKVEENRWDYWQSSSTFVIPENFNNQSRRLNVKGDNADEFKGGYFITFALDQKLIIFAKGLYIDYLLKLWRT